MNLKPLKDRIIVERDQAEAEVGGIYLTEGAREKPNTGVVIAVGAGTKDVKAGDKVMFGKHDGAALPGEYSKYLLMSETHIWAVLG